MTRNGPLNPLFIAMFIPLFTPLFLHSLSPLTAQAGLHAPVPSVRAAPGVAIQHARKGGKIPWQRNPQTALTEARRKGLSVMLYFTRDG